MEFCGAHKMLGVGSSVSTVLHKSWAMGIKDTVQKPEKKREKKYIVEKVLPKTK